MSQIIKKPPQLRTGLFRIFPYCRAPLTMTSRLIPLFLSLAIPALAQDGGQLFTLYCSACHGADGNGATGGAFPPLAGSPWVGGDPDRSIKIVLHGLHGPIDVLGKTYNLEMPPQGAMLPDDQIAAILTHVRTSWGNQAGPVTAEAVKTIRAATVDRKTAWTAEELLKLHPLPLEQTALTQLISQVYVGKWTELPDFSTLKAENVEEEHDGILTVTDSTHKDNFAMVWQGDFQAPADGEYTFLLDADDAANVIIDGQSVVEIRGSGPMDGSRSQQKKTTLTKGPHKLRVEYLEISGFEGITLGWRAPGAKTWNWLSDQKGQSGSIREPIPIEPTGARPVIYRNFIAGTTARSIGVGFPGGLNLAYSADHLAPELIWTGAFIDGAPKWLDRGTDNNPPAGENLVTLSQERFLPREARFRGYKLDKDGNPTFSIQIGGLFLLDSWRAEAGALIRKLAVTGSSLEVPIPQPASISIEGASGKSTLQLSPGQPVTLTYRWK
jgi:mono/diheme cytochrome c family protein